MYNVAAILNGSRGEEGDDYFKELLGASGMTNMRHVQASRPGTSQFEGTGRRGDCRLVMGLESWDIWSTFLLGVLCSLPCLAVLQGQARGGVG